MAFVKAKATAPATKADLALGLAKSRAVTLLLIQAIGYAAEGDLANCAKTVHEANKADDKLGEYWDELVGYYNDEK